MLEWLKRHAWKACKHQKCFRSSNLRLSAYNNYYIMIQVNARDLHWGHVILIGIIFFFLFGVLCFLIDYKAPINLENKKDNKLIIELICDEFERNTNIDNLSISDEFPYPAKIIQPIYNNSDYSRLFECGSSSFYYRTFLVQYEVIDSFGNSQYYYSCLEKRFMFLKERPKQVLSTIKID